MAEGGFDIEMDPVGKGEFGAARRTDQDYKDEQRMDEDDFRSQRETSFIDDPEGYRGARPKQIGPGEYDVGLRTKLEVGIVQKKLSDYLRTLGSEGIRGALLDPTDFEVGEDHNLYLKIDNDHSVPVSFRGGTEYYKMSTLEGKIRAKGIARTASDVIRDKFHLEKYDRKSAKAIAEYEKANKVVSEANFDSGEVLGVLDTANKVIKSIETLLQSKETQTDIEAREMNGIMKAFTSIRDELANQTAKVSSAKEEKGRLEKKLTEAETPEDKARINKELEEVNNEIEGYNTSINNLQGRLQSQLTSIKETFRKVLDKNIPLREKIRVLFREQGVTIASILTAVGMTIAVIVEAVIPGGAVGTGVVPKPPGPKEPVRDWIKKQLGNLGKLLGKLAGKVAEALPGIIGAIVSWLLSATAGVVNWFASNLWALLILVIGLLLTAAREYISKKK